MEIIINQCPDCGRKFRSINVEYKHYRCVICYAKAVAYDDEYEINDSRRRYIKEWLTHFIDEDQLQEAKSILLTKLL